MHKPPFHAGFGNCAFIDIDANVWVQGANDHNQLGIENQPELTKPTKVENLPPVGSVVMGQHHTLYLTSGGEVFSCGKGFCGQLGHGQNMKISVPLKIANLHNIVDIAAGSLHSMFLSESGLVFCSGDNSKGQLGLGILQSEVKEPTEVTGLPTIKSIFCGNYHSFFIDSDGEVWGAGANNQYQLGLGDCNRRIVPQKISTLHSQIQWIECGEHSVFLDVDGIAWVCGDNSRGLLGLANPQLRPTPTKNENLPCLCSIAISSTQTWYLDTDGNVWMSGYSCNEVIMTPKNLMFLPPIKSLSARFGRCLLLGFEGNVLELRDSKTTLIGGIPPVYARFSGRTKSARNF